MSKIKPLISFFFFLTLSLNPLKTSCNCGQHMLVRKPQLDRVQKGLREGEGLPHWEGAELGPLSRISQSCSHLLAFPPQALRTVQTKE